MSACSKKSSDIGLRVLGESGDGCQSAWGHAERVCREQIHWRSIRIPNDLRCFRPSERAGFAGPIRPANCDQGWTTPKDTVRFSDRIARTGSFNFVGEGKLRPHVAAISIVNLLFWFGDAVAQ